MNKRPMSEEHKQKIREGLARRKKEKEESRIIDPGIAKIKDIKLTPQDVKNLRLLRARKTLPGFVEHVLRDMNGSKVKNAVHQIAWWEHFKYCTKIRKTTVILAPMAHAKTNWIAIALPLWLLGQNENLRIMMVSSAEKIATERLKVIGDYIKRSEAYHELFPWVTPDESSEWNSNRINIKRRAQDGGMVGSVNASVSAYGYTSREGIGARSDILIFDDVIDDINSRNPAGRETLKSLVETQWITRGEPVPILDRWGSVLSDDQIHVVVGTRYNPEDWYGTCLAQPHAYCTMIQAISQDFNGIDCTIIGSNETPEHPMYTKYKDSPIIKRSEYDDYFAAMDAAKQDSTLVVDDSVVNQPTVT